MQRPRYTTNRNIFLNQEMDVLRQKGNTSDSPTTIKCKNCGCACSSNFCPDCGQSVAEKRIDNKSFFIGIISGLSRINKGFLFTAWNLLIHPWSVIRDYIQCRRIRYVAPISMLILVCFMNAFIGALISSETHPEISDMSGGNVSLYYRIILYSGYFLLNNALAQNLTVYLPALLAIPIVYGKVGAGRYNMAEYLTAMIYMASSFIIFNIVTLPILFISESIYSTLGLCYSISICAISLYFAFPMASKKRRIGYFAIYLSTVSIIYLILLVALGLIIGLGASPDI